jgi:hypothetical protein
MALLKIDEYGVFIWPWRIIHRKHAAQFDAKARGYIRRALDPFILYRRAH